MMDHTHFSLCELYIILHVPVKLFIKCKSIDYVKKG